jgi:hypothetical protein
MKEHLNNMSRKVLNYINEQHMKIESASFHWIITKRENAGGHDINEDDLMFPGEV